MLKLRLQKKVIEGLLDKSLPIRPLLKLIKGDMRRIIKNNHDNLRMQQQLEIYAQLIQAINVVIENHKIKIEESPLGLNFDWSKVKWAFDLWITEQIVLNQDTKMTLFLDEGIPRNTFKELDFENVVENCNSRDYIGLQITDIIVVLVGKLVSQITSNTRYDFNKPDQRALLDEKYFDLNQQQYNLVVELNKFLLDKETNYHFVNDAYFDESLSLQVYIGYIASFDNFKQYTSVKPRDHVDSYFQNFVKQYEEKYSDGMKSESMAKYMFGSLKEGIEDGTVRPL